MRKSRTDEGLMQFFVVVGFFEKIRFFVLKVPSFAQNRQNLFAHDIK
jgi:hypothetical protein